MKRGKAAGVDGLTAEHLQHCHPSLPTILTTLFNFNHGNWYSTRQVLIKLHYFLIEGPEG